MYALDVCVYHCVCVCVCVCVCALEWSMNACGVSTFVHAQLSAYNQVLSSPLSSS